MLFTHERGSEASAPAANYPVLIFFGEKETRAFQTWPNLISWGRRGRAAFPHPPHVSEGAVGAQAAGSWPAPASWLGRGSRWAPCASASHGAVPARVGCGRVSPARGEGGAREWVPRKGCKPPHSSPGSVLPGEEGT